METMYIISLFLTIITSGADISDNFFQNENPLVFDVRRGGGSSRSFRSSRYSDSSNSYNSQYDPFYSNFYGENLQKWEIKQILHTYCFKEHKRVFLHFSRIDNAIYCNCEKVTSTQFQEWKIKNPKTIDYATKFDFSYFTPIIFVGLFIYIIVYVGRISNRN